MRSLLVWLVDLFYDAFVLLRNGFVSLLGPRPLYVRVELGGPYPEHRARRPWWAKQPPSIEDLRRQLRLIAASRQAAGIVVTIRDLHAGLASLQSLRSAFAAYRTTGGRVIFYLPQASTRLYYLASAADSVVMPESGTLDVVGLTLEATFMADALARIGITGEFERIAEYKSAVEPLTRSSMSEPMREAWNAILDAVLDDITGEIATARRMTSGAVRALIDQAPYSAAAARDAGLIDAVLYEDELPAYLAAGRGRTPVILPWRRARRRLRRPFRWRMPVRAVAVISVKGAIQMGESRARPPLSIPLLGGEAAGHATVTRALRAVERNPLYGAIILSVDSPGGSALASDLIWREADRVGRNKPVVAYLGNVAASGGYYVAAGARRIISQPGTITGSIGVISGKFNVRGALEHIGVYREILTRGAAAAISSPFVPFSSDERRRLRIQTEEIYDRFVDRVAAGRRMSRDRVLEIARGRVWTGRQAHGHGLVDALGDFPTAVTIAKELMGVPTSWDVPVVPIQPPHAAPLWTRGPLADLGEAWTGLAGLLDERVLALMPWDLFI
jgi:protease IV